MIYIIYLILCLAVIWFSTKCAKYVDLIDKKTHISGAFIGGVILAAITSLPELFTSLSAILIFHDPNLVLGNVLGSNIFNLTILGILILFANKKFISAKVDSSGHRTNIFTIIIFFILTLNIFLPTIQFFNINIISVIILILYIFALRHMSTNNDSSPQEASSDKQPIDDDLSLKTIIVRFIIMSVCLVAASILITYSTDVIAQQLNLGTTLAGALFLGIATSLPEVSSSVALVKRNNFNAAIGNVIGSNIFNFLIISLSDIIYSKGTVYILSKQSNSLIIFGLISSISMSVILMTKNKHKTKNNKFIYIVFSIISIICYALFLYFSM